MNEEKKARPGRPRLAKKDQGIPTYTVLSPEARAILEQLAREDVRTLAAYLRKVFLAHCREKGFKVYQ